MTEKGKQPASNSSFSDSSVSADEAASPLTMGDLLAVLMIITGGGKHFDRLFIYRYSYLNF